MAQRKTFVEQPVDGFRGEDAIREFRVADEPVANIGEERQLAVNRVQVAVHELMVARTRRNRNDAGAVDGAGGSLFVSNTYKWRMLMRARRLPRTSDILAHAPVRAPWLVWMVDDQNAALIRSGATLRSAIESAQAYAYDWNTQIHIVESPDGRPVPRSHWLPIWNSIDTTQYVYSVELRAPDGCSETVAVIGTSTSLEHAQRVRALLDPHLRARTLIVSNAPGR